MIKPIQFLLLLVLTSCVLSSCGEEAFTDQSYIEVLNKDVLKPFIYTDRTATTKARPTEVKFLVDENDHRRKERPKNELTVLHTTVENRGAGVGGIGAVVGSVVPMQNKFVSRGGTKIQADVFMPKYSFFKPKAAGTNPTTKVEGEDAKPFAEIQHIYNFRKVTSKIHSAKTAFGAYLYLLEPDPSMKDLFDIPEERLIYQHTTNTTTHLRRMAYVSSAAAAFSNLFRTPTGKSYFDVVHNHSVPYSISIALTKEFYSPYLEARRQKPPAQVFTIHNLDWDQGFYNNTFLGSAVNLMHLGIASTDAVLGVSRAMVTEGMKDDTRFSFGLAPKLKAMYQQGRLYGIFNGLNSKAYNPFEEGTLKEPKSAEHEGFDFRYDPKDIVGSKKRIKEYLVKIGLIKDANRPLFMFVGRYSMEKGMALLPPAAKKIVESGGSFIVMGQNINSAPANEIIRKLNDMKPALGGHLYVMKGNVVEEQVKFKTGNLVRAGSDFVLVPSLAEAAGLVPVECSIFGTIPVGSNTTGLQDTLRPIQWSPDFSSLKGNAFVFDTGKHLRGFDSQKSLENQLSFMEQGMVQSLEEATDFYSFSKTHKKEMNKFLEKIMAEGRTYDWSDPNGALRAYYKMYKDIIAY